MIMVGEIRDLETAEIAIQASLTGHLVFSTLHTNDAAGAVTRLVDMGVEPFLVASVAIAVIAQRLVRARLPYCRGPTSPTDEELKEMASPAQERAGGPRSTGRRAATSVPQRLPRPHRDLRAAAGRRRHPPAGVEEHRLRHHQAARG